MKVVIVDYGVGNVQSVSNALSVLGLSSQISRERTDLLNADGLILPGVGSFDVGVNNLKAYGLFNIVQELGIAGRPIFGICLGMQLMCARSEEGITAGLNFFPSKVEHLRNLSDLEKTPNIGWKNVWSKNAALGSQKPEASDYFYFSHSFFCDVDRNDVLLFSSFGDKTFPAAVRRKNFFATQFHPEKSGRQGIKFLLKFAKLCEEFNDQK